MTFYNERGKQIPATRWLQVYERYYFLDGPQHGQRIGGRNKSSRLVEDRVCSLLTKQSLSKDDLVLIMAWKLGLINHPESDRIKDMVYLQAWPSTLRAQMQFQLLDFSKSIPDLVVRMPSISAQIARNNPEYLFSIVPQLPSFGYVYILTILFFASGGKFPIYDKWAHIAATAISQNLAPGSTIHYKAIQKWRDYEDFTKLLIPIGVACSPQPTTMFVPRPVDRALWVYGHFFQVPSSSASPAAGKAGCSQSRAVPVAHYVKPDSKLDTAEAARQMISSKLESHGYRVTRGVPPCHLTVERSGTGDRFYIHVKGNKNPSPWFGPEVPESDDLFCALVVVKESRFFVLKSAEFNSLVREYRREHPRQGASGFKWSDGMRFENRWDKLPGWNIP